MNKLPYNRMFPIYLEELKELLFYNEWIIDNIHFREEIINYIRRIIDSRDEDVLRHTLYF